MTPLDLARAYIAKGDEDEVLIRKNVDDPEVSDDSIGHLVQQAIEKYVKAVLAIEQVKPRRVHDIDGLLEEVIAAGYDVPAEIADVGRWSEYAVDPRYPLIEALPPLDRATALADVRAVRAWAASIIEAQT